MLRQVSSRNHRSKGGFKLKNGIQMGLLVVICLWLLYQMKHSHDKKQAYVKRHVEEDLVDSAMFGRKSLPHIREINPEEEGKEDAKDLVQGVKHGANEEQELHTKTGSQVQESFEKRSSHEEVIAHGAHRNGQVGGSLLEVEDHEHEATHQAREKGFRGDDVSRKVVHDPLEAEHDEASHEAQERRFNGDDASSAVEHFTEVKESESAGGGNFKDEVSRFVEHFALENESESESETEGKQNSDERPNEYMEKRDMEVKNMSGAGSSVAELLDTYEGSHSRVVGNKEDESPPDRILGSNATAKVESLARAEENPQGKIDSAHPIHDNRTELTTNSTYGPEHQIDLSMNSSAVPQSQVDSQQIVVDLATSLAYPQGQFPVSHTSRDPNDSAIEIPGENYRLMSTATVTNLGAMEESSRSPPETNESRKSVPSELRLPSHGVGEKEEQRDAHQFNLQNVQSTVENGNLEAAQ